MHGTDKTHRISRDMSADRPYFCKVFPKNAKHFKKRKSLQMGIWRACARARVFARHQGGDMKKCRLFAFFCDLPAL
jgi:hypothetical protein